MPLSTIELAAARDIVGRILEEFSLDGYVFDVEPTDKEILVKLECAVEGGWESRQLLIDRGLFQRSREDPGARQSVRDQLRQALSVCLPEGK